MAVPDTSTGTVIHGPGPAPTPSPSSPASSPSILNATTPVGVGPEALFRVAVKVTGFPNSTGLLLEASASTGYGRDVISDALNSVTNPLTSGPSNEVWTAPAVVGKSVEEVTPPTYT